MAISVVQSWHQIVETRNLTELDKILHDDVIFHSPVVHTPQIGKEITMKYLSAAFTVFFNDSFRYVRAVESETDAMLEFTVTIDGIIVNGVDMMRWNEEGKITEFKVLIRPLKAIQLIHLKMGSLLKSNT